MLWCSYLHLHKQSDTGFEIIFWHYILFTYTYVHKSCELNMDGELWEK